MAPMDAPTSIPSWRRKKTETERRTIILEHQTRLIKRCSSQKLVKHCEHLYRSVPCMKYAHNLAVSEYAVSCASCAFINWVSLLQVSSTEMYDPDENLIDEIKAELTIRKIKPPSAPNS